MYISIIFISVIGTLAHFMYEISGHNKFIALFTSVNESTWEHIKIALTPSLLWGLYDGFMYGQNPNYFITKTLSLLTIIISIPLIFYSYKAILGKPIVIIDISFYIAVVCSQLVFRYFIDLPPIGFAFEYLATVGLFIIFGEYMVLTLQPIENSTLFQDPITKKYGIDSNTVAKK